MSSLSLFFWGFCLCFLLAWVFVLGVLVGRGFLPGAVNTISDLRGQISRLQGLVSHNKIPNGEAQKAENDPKLAFYDKLSSKKEEVKKKNPHEAKPKPEVSSKGSVEQKEQASTPAAKATEKSNSTNVKSTNNGNGVFYTVQLASLEDRTKAQGMIGRLKERGFDAYYNEVRIEGRTHYRVRCGRFKTREEAGSHARRLAEQSGMNGFVSKFD